MASITTNTSRTTSGLVTLSVHDSLTFEGVKIAINPDLFSGSGTTASLSAGRHHGHSRESSFSHSRTLNQHTRETSFGSTATPFPGLQSAASTSTVLPNSNPNSNLSGGTAATQDDSTLKRNENTASIQPDDILEIKVWDRKPLQSPSSDRMSRKKVNNKTSISSTIKKQQQQQDQLLAKAASKLQGQISQSSNVGVGINIRPPVVPRNTSGTGTAAAGSLRNSPIPTPTISGIPSISRSESNGSNFFTSGENMPQVPQLSKQRVTAFAGVDVAVPNFGANSGSDGANTKVQTPNLSNINVSTGTVPAPAPAPALAPAQSMGNSKPEVAGAASVSMPTPGLSVIQPFMQGAVHVNLPMAPPNKVNVSHSRMSSLGSTTSNITSATFDVGTGQGLVHGHGHGHSSHSGVFQEEDPLEQISMTHNMRLKLVVAVTDESLRALKPGGRTQISILGQIADLYELSSYDMVTVTKIDRSEKDQVQASYQADHVTITIKEQFISRGEKYQFQNSFKGKWIYSGERFFKRDGIRGTVMEIRHDNKGCKSAFITEDTKITFRSRSARIIWLVQISSEMWDYPSLYETGGVKGGSYQYGDGSCEIYFDKFVSFMYRLFEKWKALETTHSLTVVFFSRSYITPIKARDRGLNFVSSHESATMQEDDGRFFEDHFKVVIENETASHWEPLITKVKRAFIRYPYEVGWKLTSDYSRLPSYAEQGNTLEAINTALNMLQLHYIDRDLYRSGNSVVVVTAGSGVFEVDKDLAEITKQRMMDNGIGSDMLSLGLPPLHIAPFMLFKEPGDDSDDWRAHYDFPHWMHLSFVNYDRDSPKPPVDENPVPNEYDGKEQHPRFSMANGFILRHRVSIDETKTDGRHQSLTVSQRSQRDFDDILEACRPRNRGSSIRGIPKPLLFQLKLFGLVERNNTDVPCIMEGDERRDKSNALKDSDFSLSFVDSAPGMGLSASYDGSLVLRRQDSGSNLSTFSSTSSNFTTYLSTMLGRSPMSPTTKYVQIQQSSTLEIPCSSTRNSHSQEIFPDDEGGDILLSRDRRSNSVISSGGSSESFSYPQRMDSLEAMLKAMDLHDSKLSYRQPPVNETVVATKSKPLQGDGADNDVTPKMTTVQTGSGIGAALMTYNGTPEAIPTAQPSSLRRNESSTVTRLRRTMNAVSSNNLRYTGNRPLSRPTLLAQSLDENSTAVGLNVSRHGDPPTSHNSSTFLPGFSLNNFQKSNSQSALDDKSQLSSSPPAKIKIVNSTLRQQRSPAQERISVRNKKAKAKQSRVGKSSQGTAASHHSRRKQYVRNPFRQEDEKEVLKERTHNSRRWSHVFPEGEIEFVRHSGPNWKSLCQPATLPVTIDVFPPDKELNDKKKYEIKEHDWDLDANSHSEIMLEMTRQRIIQDFQIIPKTVLAARSSLRGSHMQHTLSMEHSTLSMGHRIHIISYEPTSESMKVRVTQYTAKNTTNEGQNTHSYKYNVWMPLTERYQQVCQTFQRFPGNYPWNTLDEIISGNTDENTRVILNDKMKYRRIAFSIIPDKFSDRRGEDMFLKKIRRLIEYLEKQARKELPIRILSSDQLLDQSAQESSSSQDPFTHFIIDVRKREKEKYEFIEVAVDKQFVPRKSYRIIFKWLICSAAKVEDQVKMLQRRCSQFGLFLVNTPEMSSYSDIFLNPYHRPETISVSNREKSQLVERALIQQFGFCDDGKKLVRSEDAEKAFGVKFRPIENKCKRSGKTILKYHAWVQQYIHRSGTLFVRLLHDANQSVTLVFLENRRLIGNDTQLKFAAKSSFRVVNSFIVDLEQNDF